MAYFLGVGGGLGTLGLGARGPGLGVGPGVGGRGGLGRVVKRTGTERGNSAEKHDEEEK